jgi:protein SCO1/2
MMRNLFILSLVVLLAVLLSGCEKPKLPSPFHADDIGAMFTQADFRLTDHNGKTRTLADFRGKAVALFFGYTHCPDVCPTTLADLSQAMQKLGKDADRVQVLFITIDPERDKPEMMAKYVPAFYPSFLGLYGDAQATAQAAKSFYVGFEKRPTSSGYNMDHSTGTFLVDPSGKVRLRAPFGQSAGWLAEDIRLLLAGG